MHKKALIIGSIFGLIAPVIGLFVGLQVSVMLGNILLVPVIALSALTGEAFGTWSGGMRILAWAFSVVFWAVVFGYGHALIGRFQSVATNSNNV